MDSQSQDKNIACQDCKKDFIRTVGYELSCLACVETVRNIQNIGGVKGIIEKKYPLIFKLNMLFLYPDTLDEEELAEILHEVANTSIVDAAANNTSISDENDNNEKTNTISENCFKCCFEECSLDDIKMCTECKEKNKNYCNEHFNHELHEIHDFNVQNIGDTGDTDYANDGEINSIAEEPFAEKSAVQRPQVQDSIITLKTKKNTKKYGTKLQNKTYKLRGKYNKIKSSTKTTASKNNTKSLMIAKVKNDVTKDDVPKITPSAEHQQHSLENQNVLSGKVETKVSCFDLSNVLILQQTVLHVFLPSQKSKT